MGNELGAGDKFFVGADVTNVQSADIVSSVSSNVAQAAIAMQFIDYDYIKCEAGGSGMSDLLPLMMMMMLLDSDDDDADDDSCLKEFGIEHVFINTAGTIAKSTADADIINFFKTGSFTSGVAKDFNECLADPTDYDFGSGLSDLLPLM